MESLAPYDKKILVADDDQDVRNLLVRILERAGYQPIEATDGLDAISKMREDITLAILDNSMPRATGMECLAHFQQKV